MTKAQWKSALLYKKIIAQDIVEIRMEKPADFSYQAGQFIQFLIPDGEKTVLRAYSIASHPFEESLEFCVKLVPGGRASAYFANAAPTMEIIFQGPNGKFTPTETNTDPLSFIATGAGLAPIWGLITHELKNKKNIHPIRLLFGVRNEQDIFWTDRLDALSKECPNFSYMLTLSQPTPLWAGLTGRVTNHLKSLDNQGHFFLCGSADMVKDVRAALLAKDIPAANIHFEIF